MNLALPGLLLAHVDPIMIPFFLFGIGGIIAVVSIITHHQRQRAWYEVVRLSIEKGQPLSQLSEFDPKSLASAIRPVTFSQPLRTPRRDLRSALILIAVSAGLYFGFAELNSENIRVFPGFALIPGFIGVALLINALIGVVFPPKREDTPTTTSKL